MIFNRSFLSLVLFFAPCAYCTFEVEEPKVLVPILGDIESNHTLHLNPDLNGGYKCPHCPCYVNKDASRLGVHNDGRECPETPKSILKIIKITRPIESCPSHQTNQIEEIDEADELAYQMGKMMRDVFNDYRYCDRPKAVAQAVADTRELLYPSTPVLSENTRSIKEIIELTRLPDKK